ncbi:MAG: hypothetical protein LBW85_09355 [Deltaproteobacteria bacterium]|jgi:tRNA1(Val) A37 N6-methylase TrmN6|nr:hypothetical protein [Deltaproteobacteria bacterium]
MPPPVLSDWLQPARGYRFTRDSILLARYLPERSEGIVADLGAGCGVVVLEALAQGRLAGVGRIVLVEKDPRFLSFLEANVERARDIVPGLPPVFTLIADWKDLSPADLGGPATLAASNPPYFAPGTGRPPMAAGEAPEAPPEARGKTCREGGQRRRQELDSPQQPFPPVPPAEQMPADQSGDPELTEPCGPSEPQKASEPPENPQAPETPEAFLAQGTFRAQEPLPQGPGSFASESPPLFQPFDPERAGDCGRWEVHGGIVSLLEAAAKILAPGGSLRLCFPRRRLPELVRAAGYAGLTPFVYGFPAAEGLPLALAGLRRPPWRPSAPAP